MFKIKGYEVKNLMKAQELTAAEVAKMADIPVSAVENICNNCKGAAIRDFAPLVRLGKVLKCSPFQLIQNQTAF